MYEQYLQHHGVLGMKWGVRRYQNKDGSLTPAGKKKYSKEYEKLSKKVGNEIASDSRMRFVNIYNKAADRMNNGETDRFNAEQEKKYGANYGQRKGYMDDYSKRFDEIYAETYNETLAEVYDSSESYRNAEIFCKKYNMTSWNDLAKQNMDTVSELREVVKGYQSKRLERAVIERNNAIDNLYKNDRKTYNLLNKTDLLGDATSAQEVEDYADIVRRDPEQFKKDWIDN